MGYPTLRHCLNDLESTGQLVRVREEIDANLEMASVHMHVNKRGGPALLFENIRNCRFPAVSNIFGTLERARYIFRNEIRRTEKLIRLKDKLSLSPAALLKNFSLAWYGRKARPVQTSSGQWQETALSALPQLKCWPDDGGAFITLPQVYTEDPYRPGWASSNLGMYRIQISGNEYLPDRECGLHYQLHRGIGVHQSAYIRKGLPMPVSIFVGGPPSDSLAAVMPLPEGMSELTFAGLMNGKPFSYSRMGEFLVSSKADFIIHGTVHGDETKPEGPFGDHLGYYSLVHPFPLMKVKRVLHREGAIWPFTVVGRPPQEDSVFGKLIHELTGDVLQKEIPGLQELNAVDESGVHPLLLAIGKERYTPYESAGQPKELLTIANRILGTGQLSLAKYLFIGTEEGSGFSTLDKAAFFRHLLSRIDLSRDLHFHTNTSIDTLDYSGDGLHSGSKLVLAAGKKQLRPLSGKIPGMNFGDGFHSPMIVCDGVLVLSGEKWKDRDTAVAGIRELCRRMAGSGSPEFTNETTLPLVMVCDDVSELQGDIFRNFLWIAFTRSNPSRDVYGVNEFIENKHWGCRGSLVIDARKKPHHAPVLTEDPEVLKKTERFFKPGASLHKWA